MPTKSLQRSLSVTRKGVDTLVRPAPVVLPRLALHRHLVSARHRSPGRTEWRTVREDLGVPEITTHSFRKTVATLIDDEGLSARIGADHLGHSKVSMTQDRYMARGRVHAEVATLLDRAIKDE